MSARRHCGGPLLMLVVVIGVGACAPLEGGKPGAGPQPAPLSSSAAVFVRETSEAKLHQALVREQDARLVACGKHSSCARIHFTRALLALYESRTAAAKHFQDVMAVAPNTHLASSSQAWLQFLLESPVDVEPQNPLAQAAERLVRELLELEVASQALEREAAVRDKKVKELTKQLEALKQIDQEMKEKSRATLPSRRARPPAEKGAHP